MRPKSKLPRPNANALAAVLTGGAFCMLAVTALWLASATGERNGSAREPAMATPVLGDQLERAPLAPPTAPDAGRRSPREPEGNSVARLDRELAAGDEGQPLVRDLLIPPTFDVAEPVPDLPEDVAVPDAGAPAPQAPAAESPEPNPPDAGRSSAPAVPQEPPPPEPCGTNECSQGLVCCNASCGTCVAPGETCSQLTCSMPAYPLSAFCGRNTCSVGEVCCNLSCGICARPGESCSQRTCD